MPCHYHWSSITYWTMYTSSFHQMAPFLGPNSVQCHLKMLIPFSTGLTSLPSLLALKSYAFCTNFLLVGKFSLLWLFRVTRLFSHKVFPWHTLSLWVPQSCVTSPPSSFHSHLLHSHFMLFSAPFFPLILESFNSKVQLGLNGNFTGDINMSWHQKCHDCGTSRPLHPDP